MKRWMLGVGMAVVGVTVALSAGAGAPAKPKGDAAAKGHWDHKEHGGHGDGDHKACDPATCDPATCDHKGPDGKTCDHAGCDHKGPDGKTCDHAGCDHKPGDGKACDHMEGGHGGMSTGGEMGGHHMAGPDGRKPLPLLGMMADHQKMEMRHHLEAVQEVVDGVASKDFAKVEAAANRLGPSAEMAGMCEHLGAAAPGFTQQGMAFHETAAKMVAPARAKDAQGVMTALSATLQSCTACHAAWKQQVLDPPAYEKAVKDAAAAPH